MILYVLVLALQLCLLALSQSIVPPAIPLAVRSPYFQAYFPYSLATNKSSFEWPNFWTTGHILGWAGLLRVDGQLYNWLGRSAGLSSPTPAILLYDSYQITPTRTIFTLKAGNMAINVTFLSPIEPHDLVLQSFPFTYVFFEASSTDGKPHSVQVYQDITGEWVAYDINNDLRWGTITNGSVIYHQAQLYDNSMHMDETNNMTEDGMIYHVTNPGSGVASQAGVDTVTRSAFLNDGTLSNNLTSVTDYRPINEHLQHGSSSRWPVFAFSRSLGNITSTSPPVIWGISLVRNRDIMYTTTAGNQTRQPYFFTKYSDMTTAFSDLMDDASSALKRVIELDDQIISDASKISSNYTDLVALALRQVMAGMEITVGTDTNGQVNDSDILIFMKDIGNSRRTNPVDVMYAAFPAILYINASWAGYLLKPLLQFQSSELYNKDFAAEDLGNVFPMAVGNSTPSPSTGMESTGDMLIMVWAHATFSGDGSLLSPYYFLLKKWADTLVSDHPLTPSEFTSADGSSNANMTNLAIKGILAIRSMAEISQAVGESDDYNYYFNLASSFVSQWHSLANSSNHLTSTYGAPNSWGLMYNLYPDKLLGFNLVDDTIYSEQTLWYSNAISSAQAYGLPFDGNQGDITKSHWTLFTAGTVTNSSTRDSLVSMVHAAAITQLNSNTVFPTTYSASNGSLLGGGVSPAQGAMFALLAPNLARKAVSTSLPAGSQSSRSSKSNIGEISGAVGGTMVIVIVVFLYCRHRARKRVRSYHDLEKAASRGFFTMLFKLKKGHQRSPSQAPLDPFVHDGTEAHEMTRVRGGGRGLIPAQKVTGAQPHQEPAGLTGSILHGHEVPTSRKVTLNSNKSVSRTSTAINSEPGRQDSATTVAGQGETSSPDVDADLRGEVEILRREVGEMENLRREVEEMRMLRGEYDEPPPEYQAPSQDGEQGDEFPGS